MTQNNKINFILFNTGLFCFLFLWDLKFDTFQFRYLITLPFFLLIFNNKIYDLKYLFNIFLFPNLILIHFFLNIVLNDYNLESRDVFGLFFLYIIFFVTLQNINNIEKSLEIIINIFTILFSILFIIFFIYSNSQINLDCYDGWFFQHKFIF